MYILYGVWASLEEISDMYLVNRKRGSFDDKTAAGFKYAYKSILTARIDQLSFLDGYGWEDTHETDECLFLSKLIDNGWTPTDMKLMVTFYEAVDKLQDEELREAGMAILDRLKNDKISTMAERIDHLAMMVGFNNKLNDPDVRDLLNECMDAPIHYAEYPEDKELEEGFRKDGAFDSIKYVTKGKPIKEYEALYTNAMNYSKRDESDKQAVRDNKDYIREEKTDEELEKFQITEGHKHNNITKSNRSAIKEVYGDEIYDEIDEMSKGTDEERTITIHHALGNEYLRKGEDVLELDYAGSGFKETRKEYHGHHGKTFSDETRNSETTIESEFGKLVPNGPNSTYKYLRSKTKEVQVGDKTMKKTRYTIAGPSPEHNGIWNLGEYSIENTRAYGKKFATEFLKDIFERWDNGEAPHDVHLDLTGHSRGGVAAGECVRLVNNWLKKYVKNNPTKAHYADHVKYKLLLRDPVPGAVTSIRLGTCDLRKIPNVDATVFCSMAQEHYDLAFPLQYVKGAKRIIIGTTDHNMDLSSIDLSQIRNKKDGKPHKEGFYDAETGEYFRGSGLSEMPDGVYIADNQFNVIRISSYSQVGKLIDAVYDGHSKQKGRVETIHRMARNWFIENELQMGFADEDAYEEASKKNQETEKKLLGSKVKRLNPVKRALRNLQTARSDGSSAEQIIEKQKALIDACRKYMKKTKIPATGDSEYRVGLVSDLLSYTMREKNYITRENNLDNGMDPGRALDEKIRAHKDRLLKKPGYLERKVAKEEKRLANEESIQKLMQGTSKWCKQAISDLSNTRKGKLPSETYFSFIETLKEGAKIGDKTSISQYKNYLSRLNQASVSYYIHHISPGSDDGKIRGKYSEGFCSYSKKTYDLLVDKSKFIVDKNKPISKSIQDHKEKITEYKAMLPEDVKLQEVSHGAAAKNDKKPEDDKKPDNKKKSENKKTNLKLN